MVGVNVHAQFVAGCCLLIIYKKYKPLFYIVIFILTLNI